MPTTTPTSITVEQAVMDDYNAVQGGMSKSDRAKQRGISASTVGANVKRITEALRDGVTVNISNGGTVTGAPTSDVPEVDPRAIADAMADGSSMVIDALLTLEDEVQAQRNRAHDILQRAQEQANTINANADALLAKGTPRIARGFEVYGLDRAAWEQEVANANAKREYDLRVATLDDAKRKAYDALDDDAKRATYLDTHAPVAS